jgi:hypothetical protein
MAFYAPLSLACVIVSIHIIIVRGNEDIDPSDDAHLLGFLEMQHLVPLPTYGENIAGEKNWAEASAQNVTLTKQVWWKSLLHDAEIMNEHGKQWEAIPLYMTIFNTCCRTIQQIESCKMVNTDGHQLRISFGKALLELSLLDHAKVYS